MCVHYSCLLKERRRYRVIFRHFRQPPSNGLLCSAMPADSSNHSNKARSTAVGAIQPTDRNGKATITVFFFYPQSSLFGANWIANFIAASCAVVVPPLLGSFLVARGSVTDQRKQWRTESNPDFELDLKRRRRQWPIDPHYLIPGQTPLLNTRDVWMAVITPFITHNQ